MSDEAAQRRAERAARASSHVDAQRRRDEQESAKAQVLVDRFVEQATRAGLPTEELTARPWSGGGRYRTGIVGWYVRRDRSIGVSVDGGYYLLVVPTVRFGRWRTVECLRPRRRSRWGEVRGTGRRSAWTACWSCGCSGERVRSAGPQETGRFALTLNSDTGRGWDTPSTVMSTSSL